MIFCEPVQVFDAPSLPVRFQRLSVVFGQRMRQLEGVTSTQQVYWVKASLSLSCVGTARLALLALMTGDFSVGKSVRLFIISLRVIVLVFGDP